MGTMMDRRLVDRTQAVNEHSARRRLRRLLTVVFLIAIGGFGGWMLYQSSYLAVAEVSVDGATESRARTILDELGVRVGAPTINLRQASIEEALLADPWIAAAVVRVTWPGSVTVELLEFVPAGWVEAGDRWLLVAATGEILASVAERNRPLPSISVGSSPAAPGEKVDEFAAASLDFIGALPDGLVDDVVVRGGDDELQATVAGRLILLGYPTDMAAKATALVAVLESGVPTGVEISVVSPERPAVDLRPDIETSDQMMGEPQPVG